MDTKLGYFALSLIALALIQQATASHMLLYGDVTVDGKSAPIEATIVAKMADGDVGNCTVTEEGIYGILIISNKGGYTPINFYIGNSKAIQVVTFVPEGVMVIDLDFETIEETTTTIRRVELPTTVIQSPGIIGMAVSFTTNNGTIFGFIIVFVLIFFFIRDLL